MAKSPFSTAGGGNADARPHEYAARKCGGAVKGRAEGGSATLKEAKGRSIGFVEGEDAKPRLDRKRGGKAPRGR
jgi:hypothetical protein